MSKSKAEINGNLTKVQEEMKKSTEYLSQLKELLVKTKNDIKVVKERIDTYSGAVQAFNIALNAIELDSSSENVEVVS